MKIKMNLWILLCVFSTILVAQENHKELIIEDLSDDEAYDIKGDGCNPGDIIITIKSDIKNLFFDSNIIDIDNVSFIEKQGEYIFCHINESFWLTIGAQNHISKRKYIDGKKTKYAFRVVKKAAVGKVLFKTRPDNALIDFGFEGQSPQLTGEAIEINSGEYKVRISKHGYISVDTLIQVPSGGNISHYDIYLKPAFSKIQLDIKASDNSEFMIFPTVEIDTARINLGELMNNNKNRTFDDVGNLEYFKIYEGGIIPVPDGTYAVTITTPGFKSYFTRIIATKGTVVPLSTSLEPITGYLTVIDKKNAIGAKVIIDDKYIGKIPLYRQKVRVGKHLIRIEKDGYLSEEKEYTILSKEGDEIDLPISMTVFKKYFFNSVPTGAEILINDKREGFTPSTVTLGRGKHKIEFKKYGFLDFKKYVEVNKNVNTTSVDTINCIFENNVPFTALSEEKGLYSIIKRKEDRVFTGNLPATVNLPIGKYKMYIYDEKGRNVFKGNVNHTGNRKIKFPNYSRGTFTSLVGDYYFSKPALSTSSDDFYKLVATGQFGRFNLFPGLSTSILKASMFSVNDDFEDKIIPYVSEVEGENEKYPSYLFAGSCLFLNAELRIGVPILRSLDIAALGTFTYYPELKKILPVNHVNGEEIFIGIELASRISSFNFTVKIGSEIFNNGSLNFYTGEDASFDIKDYSEFYHSVPVDLNQFVITVGFTLGEKIYNGNNMYRIVKKPLISRY